MPSWVQSVESMGGVVAVSFSPTQGSLIIGTSCTSIGAGAPTASITDNLSDSWTTLIATTTDAINQHISAFALSNCPSGITTVTFSYNGGNPGQIFISLTEISGAATVSPVTVHIEQGQANPGTGTDAISSGTASTSGYILGVTVGSTGHPISAGTGYTQRFSGASAQTLIEDVTQGSSGTYAATFTSPNGGTTSYSTFMFAISPPANSSASIAWLT